MTFEEIKARAKELGELADKQQNGAFTTESDAQMALHLVGSLSLLLVQMLDAKDG